MYRLTTRTRAATAARAQQVRSLTFVSFQSYHNLVIHVLWPANMLQIDLNSTTKAEVGEENSSKQFLQIQDSIPSFKSAKILRLNQILFQSYAKAKQPNTKLSTAVKCYFILKSGVIRSNYFTQGCIIVQCILLVALKLSNFIQISCSDFRKI